MPSFDELAQERVKLLYEYQYGNDSERTANKTRLKENEKKLKLDVKKNKFKSDYLKEWFGKNPFDLPKLDKKPKDISFDIDEFNFLNDQRSALLRKIKSPSTPKAEKMNALNAFKKNTEALTPHMKSINELKEIVEQLEIDIPRSQQAVNRATAKLNHRLEKTLTVPLKENPVLSSLQQPTYLAHLSDKLTEAKKNLSTETKIKGEIEREQLPKQDTPKKDKSQGLFASFRSRAERPSGTGFFESLRSRGEQRESSSADNKPKARKN